MRKLNYLLIALTLSISACENGFNDEGKNQISLSTKTIKVDFESDEHTIKVTSPYSWIAESKNDWISLTCDNGIAGTEELRFVCDRNLEESERKGTILIKNEDFGLAAELYVTQKPFVPELVVYQDGVLSFTEKGGTDVIKVSSNFGYEVSDDASWISCYKIEEGVKVSVSASDVANERTATITIYSEKYNLSYEVEIAQKAFDPQLSIDKEELYFDVNGGSKTVNVTTNAEFSVSESANWITCVRSGNSIKITVSASTITEERIADVKIYLPKYEISKIVKVSQREFVPELDIDKMELSFGSDGGSETVSITSNARFTVSKTADWLTCVKNDKSISITAAKSAITEMRIADVIINLPEYEVSKIIKVVQAPFIVELEAHSYEVVVSAESQTITIPISANINYNITESANWLSCRIVNNGIEITTTPNVEEKENIAKVEIYNTTYNISKSITIIQERFVPTIVVDQTELTFGPEGGKQTLSIVANFEYSMSKNADWLSYKINGNNIEVSAISYDIVEDRYAEILIANTKYNIEKVIKVVQKAFTPTLSIDKSELEFEFEGGNKTINIATNAAEFNVLESSDWITCSKNNRVVSIIVQPSTITQKRIAHITICLPKYNIEEVLTITQKEFVPYITANISELNFEAYGGTQKITVNANFEYSVSSDADWLNCTVNENTIQVSSLQNIKTQSNRTSYITIGSKNYNVYIRVKVTQRTYELGDIVTINTAKGIVFYKDNNTTKIVSISGSSSLKWQITNYAFITTNAIDRDNGANNMAVIQTITDWAAKFPVFKWCANYGTNWYPPASNELKAIYNARSTINPILSANGYTTIGSDRYWTSTESGYGNACFVDFGNGVEYAVSMNTTYRTLAIYTF